MLTTNQHHDDYEHENHGEDDEDIPVHCATAADAPALLDAFRQAVHAARVIRGLFLAHGIGPDRATVTATLTDGGQPFVLITAQPRPGNTHICRREQLGVITPLARLAQRFQNAIRPTIAGGEAGGPPRDRTISDGRAA